MNELSQNASSAMASMDFSHAGVWGWGTVGGGAGAFSHEAPRGENPAENIPDSGGWSSGFRGLGSGFFSGRLQAPRIVRQLFEWLDKPSEERCFEGTPKKKRFQRWAVAILNFSFFSLLLFHYSRA